MAARIAVIDDDAPTRDFVTTALAGAGYSVQAAGGGEEGVELVERERPDMVLLDLMMPGVDGYAACRRIREGKGGWDPQIMVISALDEVDMKLRALDAGADAYLVKPVETRELLTRVKTMLSRAEQMRQQGSRTQGRLVVVAGAKGGVGTSTIALNLAVTHAAGHGPDSVVVADLAVPVGTLGLQLGISIPDTWGWKDFLEDGAASVHRLSSYLMRNPAVPLRLLPGMRRGSSFREFRPEPLSAFATMLHGLAEVVVVDLGNQPSPFAPHLLREADIVLVVVEPEITAVELTAAFVNRMRETGILSDRIRLVLSNSHGSLQLSRAEACAALKLEASTVILYQRDEFSAAAKRRLPLVIHDPRGSGADQFRELAKALAIV